MAGETLRPHFLPGSSAMVAHAVLAEIGAPYELALVQREADTLREHLDRLDAELARPGVRRMWDEEGLEVPELD